MNLTRERYQELINARIFEPKTLVTALASRKRRPLVGPDGKLLLIAADHTARGKISLGSNLIAMSDRFTLLERLVTCLSMNEVDGVLASADVLEELAWLGVLDNKLAIGTINRGGIIGASWELDDRPTAYDLEHIKSMGLDGGKTLLRINYTDSNVPRTIETVAKLTTELADADLMAMIEPLPYLTSATGEAVLDTSYESMVKVVAIASGLGASSSRTWLKIPPSEQMSEIAGATSLPILMLGGEPKEDGRSIFDLWARGMQQPNVRGVVAGRSLLYPVDGDSKSAVLKTAAVVRGSSKEWSA